MRIAVRENTTRPQLYKYVSKGTEDTASILETLLLPFRDNLLHLFVPLIF